MRTKTQRRTTKDHFLTLVKQFPLRPVKSESDLDDALAMIDDLLKLPRRRFTPDHEDYLESLSELVEHYEAKHHAIAPADPIDVLKHLMQQRGMTASDLGRLLGNRALGSKILKGKRELSKSNILALTEHFGIGPGLLL